MHHIRRCRSLSAQLLCIKASCMNHSQISASSPTIVGAHIFFSIVDTGLPVLCFLSSSWTAVQNRWMSRLLEGHEEDREHFLLHIPHRNRIKKRIKKGLGRWFTGKMLDMQAAEPEFKSPQPMYKFCKCIWPIILAYKKHRKSLEQAG